MMKHISLMLILLATLSAQASNSQQVIYYHHQAKILRIIDGDTFTAEIHLFPKQTATYAVRIRDIDTAEIKGKCDAEKQLAQKAKTRLEELLPIDSVVTLNRIELGTYAGRIIADVSTDAVEDIGAQMIADKLARPYDVREGRQSWCGL